SQKLVTNDPQPCLAQTSTQVQVVQISNTSEPTVHEEISQNLPNEQEVDIEVISPKIKVIKRILVESHDVENNENVSLSSRVLYAEIVNDTPFWVDCEVKKKKRVVK
ncbi:hypothetical protein KI387_044492, partial [Taxus chinensis]